MNRLLYVAVAACCLVTSRLCLGAAEKVPVPNAGFEIDEDKDKTPDRWERFDTRHGKPDECVEDHIDEAEAHSGKRSGRLANRRTYLKSTSGTGWIQRNVASNPGEGRYTISVYVKASKPDTKVGIALFGTVPDWGDEHAGAVSETFRIGEEWTRISHTNTFSAKVASISILLFRRPQTEGGAVWFDDVEVIRH